MDMETRIRASFARQGMMATLGARIDAIAAGKVEISAPILAATSQQQGFGHAGLSFAIGDSAAGYAALTLIPDDQEVVTAEIKINLLAPARGTTLLARGRVIKPGRRLMVVSADVFGVADGTERHVAALMGTMVPVPL